MSLQHRRCTWCDSRAPRPGYHAQPVRRTGRPHPWAGSTGHLWGRCRGRVLLSVLPVSPRARPPETAPAERLGRLALARGPVAGPIGGWVPEQPGLVRVRAGEPCPDPRPDPRAEAALALPDEGPPEGSGPVPVEGPVEGPVAVGTVAVGTVAGLLRTARVDPGRRGAVALALVGLLAALVAGGVLLRGRPSVQPLVVPAVAGAPTTEAGPEVVVDVAGKVRRPGLVRLPLGSRVDDAIRKAGGALPGAATGSLNLARKLTDGEQVLVGVDAPAGPGGGPAGDGLLDLNTATAQDFDGLPGIGPVLADRIVSWRTEHGRFASVDQLREVSGIGESKYQSIKAKVRV
jgi:competence protein ComEA